MATSRRYFVSGHSMGQKSDWGGPRGAPTVSWAMRLRLRALTALSTCHLQTLGQGVSPPACLLPALPHSRGGQHRPQPLPCRPELPWASGWCLRAGVWHGHPTGGPTPRRAAPPGADPEPWDARPLRSIQAQGPRAEQRGGGGVKMVWPPAGGGWSRDVQQIPLGESRLRTAGWTRGR